MPYSDTQDIDLGRDLGESAIRFVSPELGIRISHPDHSSLHAGRLIQGHKRRNIFATIGLVRPVKNNYFCQQ